MFEFIEKKEAHTLPEDLTPITTLTLPLDMRQKSRQRVLLDNGEDAAIYLQRGTVLYNGDILLTSGKEAVEIRAAEEELSSVYCADPLLLARACYHLGNRHMPLQIEKDRLYYLHDHVLDDMLRGLGLEVKHICAPFEPEPGAYNGKGGHSHAH